QTLHPGRPSRSASRGTEPEEEAVSLVIDAVFVVGVLRALLVLRFSLVNLHPRNRGGGDQRNQDDEDPRQAMLPRLPTACRQCRFTALVIQRRRSGLHRLCHFSGILRSQCPSTKQYEQWRHQQ